MKYTVSCTFASLGRIGVVAGLAAVISSFEQEARGNTELNLRGKTPKFGDHAARQVLLLDEGLQHVFRDPPCLNDLSNAMSITSTCVATRQRG